MASVIGRNFYYKVLEEAAQTIEELDDKLDYLKDIQLINESKKTDEIEYLFKHALVQQATYDSILQKTKKELHLRIARSIEKVFTEKIHEFYGVLAMHYGMAEVPEKMEEYLFKAGEQSLTAGASSEALNFFRQALDTYFDYHKEDNNKQKVVDLEEKIGIALAMNGQNIEAVEYFDKVLAFYGFHIPKNDIIKLGKAVYYFLTFPLVLKYHWLTKKKKPPVYFLKIMQLLIRKGEALSSVNPRRFLIDCQYASGLLSKIDYNPSVELVGMPSSISIFYIWTGYSLKTGQMILNICSEIIRDVEHVFDEVDCTLIKDGAE
jgi:tetratricopeptide (TPR) repeat protein